MDGKGLEAGSIALVTGASAGIGRAVAVGLSARGVRVICAALGSVTGLGGNPAQPRPGVGIGYLRWCCNRWISGYVARRLAGHRYLEGIAAVQAKGGVSVFHQVRDIMHKSRGQRHRIGYAFMIDCRLYRAVRLDLFDNVPGVVSTDGLELPNRFRRGCDGRLHSIFGRPLRDHEPAGQNQQQQSYRHRQCQFPDKTL